jgi:SAM-dependent methyltransferase
MAPSALPQQTDQDATELAISAKRRRPQQATTPQVRPWFRALGLFRAFLREQSDPEYFYSMLADDAIRQVERHVDLADRTVVDVGGGGGYFTSAFRDRGAHCLLVEPDPDELRSRDRPDGISVVGDGFWLPVQDASVDVSFSSNVLEHVRDPAGFIDEMVRVTRPGGLVYVSYTLWYGPWGGHETSPWHLFGGAYAARRYERRNGRPPKNRFGETMFALRAGPVLRLVRKRTDVTVLEARPRYFPRWCGFLMRIPLLRELLGWNLLLILRCEP